jgi:Flp pilus assembly pilin Flp
MSEALVCARLGYRLAVARVASGSRRAAERLGREQRGQDLIEYGGILILVAAIITALFAIGIPGDISKFVSSAVNNIVGSGATSAATASKAG